MAKWSTQHFNALAKEIREVFPIDDGLPVIDTRNERVNNMTRRATLATLALSLARRFKEDNERFDPLKFLDACSPDPDVFPLSEFWEEDDGEE